jgi:hypothetical protein
MTPRTESILTLLSDKPHGMTAQAIRDELGLTPKPLKNALQWLKSTGAVTSLRVGQIVVWVAAQHIATAEAQAAECRRASYQRHLRRNAMSKDRCRHGAKARVRHWPVDESWTPPGPRIPSVFHLAQALGVA